MSDAPEQWPKIYWYRWFGDEWELVATHGWRGLDGMRPSARNIERLLGLAEDSLEWNERKTLLLGDGHVYRYREIYPEDVLREVIDSLPRENCQ